jgi:hypothetical protein
MVAETRMAQAGAVSHHVPAPHIPHQPSLAQGLHQGFVMHHGRDVVSLEL